MSEKILTQTYFQIGSGMVKELAGNGEWCRSVDVLALEARIEELEIVQRGNPALISQLEKRITEQAEEIERLKEHIKFLRDSHPSLQNQP